jgi:hypothetical protein
VVSFNEVDYTKGRNLNDALKVEKAKAREVIKK